MRDNNINKLAEFNKKDMEREYLNNEISKALPYIKPMLLVLSVLYFLFIIPDFIYLNNIKKIKIIFFMRISFLFLVLEFFIRVKRIKDAYRITIMITFYEILASIMFFIVFFNYENPDFIIQSFGLIILIIAVFMIPNRFINMIVVSISISIIFFILSLMYIKNISKLYLSSAIVYTFIVIILSSITSFRSNYLKRVKYLSDKKLLELLNKDTLTGIYNRFKFNIEVNNLINSVKAGDISLSLILFDLDDFKQINDLFGHVAGDKIIKEIVNLVSLNIRKGDIFARWGGEEFVLLLPNTEIEQAVLLGERIRKAIENYDFEKVGKVTCSFGITQYSKTQDAEAFLKEADYYLYEAKKAGKNIVMYKKKQA